jgi:hypothetical protein
MKYSIKIIKQELENPELLEEKKEVKSEQR